MKILICAASVPKFKYHTGAAHLTEFFQKEPGNKIFYLSDPASLIHLLKLKNLGINISKIKYSLKGVHSLHRRTRVYQPFTLIPMYNLPLLKSDFVARHSLTLTIPSLRKVLANYDFLSVDVLMVSNLFLWQVSEIVKPKIFIYRITDDFFGFRRTPVSQIEIHKKMIRTADAIVVTAHPLFDQIKKIRKSNVYYIPNGVDFEFFSESVNTIPPEYKNIPSPRIIYMGAIDHWLDKSLIEYCAKKMPECSFILLGLPNIDLSNLTALNNVHICGLKKYDSLPSYLQHADVGIIPFKIDKFINCVSPIKLYEYMAAGLPVVARPWEELERISAPVFFANTGNEFCSQIRKALKSDSKDEFVNFAKENDWSKRYRELNSIISS